MSEKNRGIIQENLNNVLERFVIPGLGKPKQGKIRDLYFVDDKVIMVTFDNVSAFDQVLDRCIPYKGAVLNAISTEMMRLAEKVVNTALFEVPDPNVIVQYRLKNIGVECIVRGYVWGSMAKDYESGEMQKCGIQLPEGLLRYQKLDEPMFTPTTKGEKDEDITMAQMSEMVNREVAEEVKDISLRLFKMYSEFAASKGLLLLDTKYEFGQDEDGNIYLIDEATTPDSSRFCYTAEWEEKWQQIQKIMHDENYNENRLVLKAILGFREKLEEGLSKANLSELEDTYLRYKNVSKLLENISELKIKEKSKQYVRDELLKAGHKEGEPLPSLPDKIVLETALRYIELHNELIGEFNFEGFENPRERMMRNLKEKGYIKEV